MVGGVFELWLSGRRGPLPDRTREAAGGLPTDHRCCHSGQVDARFSCGHVLCGGGRWESAPKGLFSSPAGTVYDVADEASPAPPTGSTRLSLQQLLHGAACTLFETSFFSQVGLDQARPRQLVGGRG